MTHTAFLEQALDLARLRRGYCAPNPAVGAVLVKDGSLIATGHHQGPGSPHAEILALAQAGENAKGATLYVTLEPCCHWGKTPPCVDALINAGVSRVYFAYQDPNPMVNGNGFEQLRAAGIHCEHIPVSAIDEFYISYAFWQQYKRPWVTAKLAMSLDGKIAGQSGNPVKITGQQADTKTHQLRNTADAVLTTVNTVNQDNPRFTVRLPQQPEQIKPIYILDSQLRLKLDASIFKLHSNITVVHAPSASEQRRETFVDKDIRLVEAPENNGLDLNHVFSQIAEDGVHDLFIEAGARLFSSLIEEKQVQRLFIYCSPKILGPNSTPGLNTAMDLSQLGEVSWSGQHDAICEINLTKEPQCLPV